MGETRRDDGEEVNRRYDEVLHDARRIKIATVNNDTSSLFTRRRAILGGVVGPAARFGRASASSRHVEATPGQR